MQLRLRFTSAILTLSKNLFCIFPSVWTSHLCPHIMKHVAWQDTRNSDVTGHARISTMNLSIPIAVPAFFMGTAVATLTLLYDCVWPQWPTPNYIYCLIWNVTQDPTACLFGHWETGEKPALQTAFRLLCRHSTTPSAAWSFAVSWFVLFLVEDRVLETYGNDSWEKNI